MARRAASGATGTAGQEAGDVSPELAKLRRSVEQLGQGLVQLLDATETHTEMLRALLAAAAAPTAPEQELATLLSRMVILLDTQNEQLRSIADVMIHLPVDVGKAVSGQLGAALAAVR